MIHFAESTKALIRQNKKKSVSRPHCFFPSLPSLGGGSFQNTSFSRVTQR